MHNPSTSIVTVTYNSAEALRRHWVDWPVGVAEWIVVDNASSDNSADVAASLGARVIDAGENLGFGRACNLGAASTTSEVVAFVNPDVSVGWRDLPNLARGTSGRVIVAPQLLNLDGTQQPNGRGVPSLFNKIRNRIQPRLSERSDYQLFAPIGCEVDAVWLTGAALFMSRETWDDLGGFDDRYFVYFEDVDLSLRAAAIGIRRTVMGDVRWTHGWARESTGLNLRGRLLEIDGAIRFYSRYPRLVFGSRIDEGDSL